MQELIELRKIIAERLEKAENHYSHPLGLEYLGEGIRLDGRISAFSEVIRELDLILNNSVVKPSERRSPTDESFNGCKPPDERQNPLEEKSECSEDYHNSAIKLGLTSCLICNDRL